MIPQCLDGPAALVFAGLSVTVQDARRDYGEDRFITPDTCRAVCGAGSAHLAARSVASYP
jgi:hypothetical protein